MRDYKLYTMPVYIIIYLLCNTNNLFANETNEINKDKVEHFDGCSDKKKESQWSPQEKWVWGKLITGASADLNEYDPLNDLTFDPKDEGEWPKRVICSQFLEAILFEEPFRSKITRHGVRIYGAMFVGVLNLIKGNLTTHMILINSRFDSDVYMSFMDTKEFISFRDSVFYGEFDMHQFKSNNKVDLSGGTWFMDVSLVNAKIDGPLLMGGSEFRSTLDMTDLLVNNSLGMSNGTYCCEVILENAEIRGSINMGGSSFEDKLKMDGAIVGKTLFMSDSIFNDIDLNGATIDGQLNLSDSKLKKVNLNSAQIKSLVSLSNSNFSDELNMTGIKVGRSLLMYQSTFKKVFLPLADIGGNLDINGSKFSDLLSIYNSKIGENLSMNGKAQFSGVALHFTEIRGGLDMSGSKFSDDINMEKIIINEDLIMTKGATFTNVNLARAKIGGMVNFNNSTFTGQLNMHGLNVDGSLYVTGKAKFSSIIMIDANIGGELILSGSKFNDYFNMQGVRIKGSMLINKGSEFTGVDLSGAQINGVIGIEGATFNGKLNIINAHVNMGIIFDKTIFLDRINIVFSEIGNNLFISDNQIYILDLTSTKIKGILSLGFSKKSSPKWSEKGEIILLNTKVGMLQAFDNSWPTKVKMIGFDYSRIGGLFNDSVFEKTCNTTWFENWLKKQKQYSPQPYEHLAIVLKREGCLNLANSILYLKNKRYRNEESSFIEKCRLFLYEKIIGYGYRSYYALAWISLLIIIGAFILYQFGQGKKHNIGFAYSLDMVLPFVTLRKYHYDGVDLEGLTRIYYYLHKIVGYVLMTLFIAGWSGLIK